MFPILDFPNELLHRTVRLVQWSDLVPFALSCKTIHNCCGMDLKERLALKKYSTLTFGGFDVSESRFCDPEAHIKQFEGSGVDAKHNALLLLGSILDEPDVARWPRLIRIGGGCDEDETFFDQDELDDDYRDKMQQVVTRHSTGLKKIIDDCVFIPEVDKASTFESLCKPTGEVVALRLLLTLLPNVQDIAFQSNSRRLPKLAEIVESIATANRDPSSPHRNKALVHLSKVSMDRADTEMGENPHIYGPFAMLPSLKNIQGCKIDGESFDWPHSFHDLSSNVTEIEIEHSAVSSAAFSGLLGGISALRKLTYHHACCIIGDEIYDPAGIMTALRQHAAHSLVSLDVTADQYNVHSNDEEDQHVGSLRMFQKLRNIRLDEYAFHFRIRDPLGNVQALPDGQFYDDEALTEEDGWEPLVDILPASVRAFTLVQYSDPRDIRELFENMGAQKSEKLPKLKIIRFDHGHDKSLEPDMIKELKDAGFVLKSWNVII